MGWELPNRAKLGLKKYQISPIGLINFALFTSKKYI